MLFSYSIRLYIIFLQYNFMIVRMKNPHWKKTL